MIAAPTVLVLGAGSSCDFNFPLGRRLKLGMQAYDQALHELLHEMGYQHGELRAFQHELAGSDASTIDEFLTYQPHWGQIAKLAIAFHVGKHEGDAAIADCDPPHWMHLLFRLMRRDVSSPEEFARQNKLSVITFNYDRSFERCLWRALAARFPLPQHATVSIAHAHQSVRLIHVHGHLGDLPEVVAATSPTWCRPRAYAPPSGVHDFSMAAGGIKVISEISGGESDFGVASKLLAAADKIVFLGFGFDETNMARLGMTSLRSGAKVFACTYGLNRKRWRDVRGHLISRGVTDIIEHPQHKAAAFVEAITENLLV